MNRTRTIALGALPLLTLASASSLRADEGMWTYNNPPRDLVKQRYGFAMDDKWLDHLRLSSARIAGGCSASFVSESGLVMTNHHCAHSCIQQLSTPEKDFVQSGFYAESTDKEVKCPELEINQLAAITDVTDRINKATAGLSDQKYNEAMKAEMSRIEKECATSDKVRCDVVSLYHGGRYNLYKYNRYQDVRLVFAPEFAIAFFGGDPDNFMFPRYDLDVSFLRVYDDGKPAKMEHYLKWSPAGAKEGELTFVSGHPGGTSRQLTVDELRWQRDVILPARLFRASELRGQLTIFEQVGADEKARAEHKRIAEHDLFGIENGYKALRGRLDTLLDAKFFQSKVDEENALRAKIASAPEKQKKYGGAWDAIARALDTARQIRKPYAYMEGGSAMPSDLAGLAKALVRAADERTKPNDKRFREFRDSALPEVTQRLLSKAPIYDDKEILFITFGLTKMREELGADHPFVRKVLGKESPAEMAARLVKGTKLKSVEARKALWDGGKAAVDASDDPLVQLYRSIDGDARAIRKRWEDEVESVLKKNDELIAKARFEATGTGTYPDATFTLRLSYGQVKGYMENGAEVKPITTFGGAFDRATGRDPFALPPSWLAQKGKLDLATAFNLATTNDIIGGNSGSPVVNKNGEVVGLVFDGNIQSLGGDYGFDESVNRTVAVASQALIEALDKIYGAARLVKELRPAAATTKAKAR